MVGVTNESALAFSLWRKPRGWAWGVYDLEGEEVASGAAETRQAAEAAISEIYLQTPAAAQAA